MGLLYRIDYYIKIEMIFIISLLYIWWNVKYKRVEYKILNIVLFLVYKYVCDMYIYVDNSYW